MHIPTHILSGWICGNFIPSFGPRERFFCMVAASAPDLDGLSLLGGWVYAAAMCALYFLFGWQLGAVGYLMLFTLITLAFSAGLYVWLRRKGGAVFATL